MVLPADPWEAPQGAGKEPAVMVQAELELVLFILSLLLVSN